MNNQIISGTPFENYIPPSWDIWFFQMMYKVASKSKDPKTKIGAILVRDRHIVTTGYNGICRGVNDDVPERSIRPTKYSWYEHGERNAIYSAARMGEKTEGTIMYTNGIPCTDCARAIIQAGIVKVIVHKTYEDLTVIIETTKEDRKQWKGHNEISTAMFQEAGVSLEIFDQPVGEYAYLDGMKYLV